MYSNQGLNLIFKITNILYFCILYLYKTNQDSFFHYNNNQIFIKKKLQTYAKFQKVLLVTNKLSSKFRHTILMDTIKSHHMIMQNFTKNLSLN